MIRILVIPLQALPLTNTGPKHIAVADRPTVVFILTYHLRIRITQIDATLRGRGTPSPECAPICPRQFLRLNGPDVVTEAKVIVISARTRVQALFRLPINALPKLERPSNIGFIHAESR